MENVKYCPVCSNGIEENMPCEHCEANAVVLTCFHCNFGEDPCICGDSPDYNPEYDPFFSEDENEWENEDDEEENDETEHYL